MCATAARWLAVGWLSLMGAAPALALSLPPDAQAGDLIFREGVEPVSAGVMALDQGPFSHVGMLVGGPGNWQVLHATPSEVPGRPDGVVRDTLDFFIDPKRARHYALYHVQATPAKHVQAVQAAQAMLGRPFRIADPTGTYCTTLVWNAWRSAGVDLQVTFTPLTLPPISGNYLLPSGILASPKLRRLALPPDRTP